MTFPQRTPPVSTKKSSSRLIWLLSLLCSSVLVILAWYMYPVSDGDAVWFLPAIKTFALHGRLENKLIDAVYEFDPKAMGRFIYYPPGFPLFVGGTAALIGLGSYNSISVLLAIVRSASVFIFAKSLIITTRNWTPSLQASRIKLILLLLIASNAFFLFASNGRPEVLSILVVSTAALAAVSVGKERLRHLAIQICIGMLFPISIANGFIGIAFYLLYLFFDVKLTLKRLSYFAASALSSGLFLLFSYTIAYSIAGVDIVDGISALQSASQGQMSRNDTSLKLLFNYWSSWSLFGLLASARCIQCARIFLRNKIYSILDVAWLVLTGLVITACIFVFGLRAAPIHYNLYAFLPVYQLLALRLLIETQLFSRKFLIFICTSALIAASVLSLFNPLRSMALFPYYLFSGSTYAEMKQQFEKIDTNECSIVYTGAVAFLDEKQSGSNYLRSDSSGIIPTERMKKDGNHFSCEVAFVQEVNGNSSIPAGMELVADLGDRSPYTKKLRSLRILNSPKGYSFKAYRRDATAPAY